jgi:two-component system sensor histidine kinase FlrB
VSGDPKNNLTFSPLSLAAPVQILPTDMNPLPNPSAGFDPLGAPSGIVLAAAKAGEFGIQKNEEEQFLLRAFHSFAQAAGSLEHSYGMLRAEVERLRRELEQSNAELARSLEENRGMREYLDRILEGLPCGVLVVADEAVSDEAGSGAMKFSRANPEALRLLAACATHDPDIPASVPTLSSRMRELIARARRQGSEQELPFPNGDAGPRWLAARHASIAGGESVFILRDVSERKRLEAAQEKLQREQALAEMSAVLAHEIRNPLASLELFAGLLAESPLDGECHQWVGHVQAGLRTLAATVNNVLHFHSLPEPERAPLDVGGLLGWARDFFAPLAGQARVAFSLQNRAQGVSVLADRHRLEQVLLNLVLNAMRAMPGGGWIELGGRKSGDGRTAILTVSDTGPGIAPEHLPRLFEPGFSTRPGSPGLGLAVCQKIIQQHGGTIGAGGRPGCGASFTITLPIETLPRAIPAGGRL